MYIYMMQVTKKLTEDEVDWLEKQQPWFDPQQLHDLRQGRLVASFATRNDSDEGIQHVSIWKSLKPKGNIYLTLLLNLEALVLGCPSFNLFEATRQSITQLQDRFDQEISPILPSAESADLMNWLVDQVDYAVFLSTPHTAKYGKLFKRVGAPAGFSITYIDSAEINIESKSKCVRLLIDGKPRVLNSNKNIPKRSKKTKKTKTKKANNALRISVNCSGDKLYDIRRTFSPETHKRTFDVFLNKKVTNTVLQEVYRQIIGYADFHSLPQALSMVEAGPGRQDRKDNVSSFLRLLNESETVGTAMKEFLAGTRLKQTGEFVQGSQRALEYYMNEYLPELNINPILIPANMRCRSLPNPMPVSIRI